MTKWNLYFELAQSHVNLLTCEPHHMCCRSTLNMMCLFPIPFFDRQLESAEKEAMATLLRAWLWQDELASRLPDRDNRCWSAFPHLFSWFSICILTSIIKLPTRATDWLWNGNLSCIVPFCLQSTAARQAHTTSQAANLCAEPISGVPPGTLTASSAQ